MKFSVGDTVMRKHGFPGGGMCGVIIKIRPGSEETIADVKTTSGSIFGWYLSRMDKIEIDTYEVDE